MAISDFYIIPRALRGTRALCTFIYIHAQEIQLEKSISGLSDDVDTVFVIRVIFWVGGRGEDSILSCKAASTSARVIAPLDHIGDFILKLKSLPTIKVVGTKPENEELAYCIF